jgi:lipopolysaccharide/colanic/teichoic acid biosynthesis glycosyltransferase
MIQARGRQSFYGPDMRDARQFRLSQSLQVRVAANPMRRSGEFLMACILLALTLPLMLIIALAIKWESSGPVFERRERIGPNGRPFHILSFRTTAQTPGPVRSTWQPTAVGHFLQSTRIKALPQLFNVLRGEMNLRDTTLFD